MDEFTLLPVACIVWPKRCVCMSPDMHFIVSGRQVLMFNVISFPQAEHRATEAERTVVKLQKEVDRLEGMGCMPQNFSLLCLTCCHTLVSPLFFWEGSEHSS